MINLPVRYTFLGFYLNSLVDSGNHLDLKETHSHIQDNTLFPWLKEKFGQELDISLYTSEDLKAITDFFKSLSDTVDENRKMGVVNNGLCLLVAYCFEALQRKDLK